MRRVRSVGVLLILLVACTEVSGWAISYPGPATLNEFGLEERCTRPGEARCLDEARRVIAETLQELGSETLAIPPDIDAALRMRVRLQDDEPLRWQAEDGPFGRSSDVTVELTEFLRGLGPPYVLIAENEAYELSEDAAQRLIDALFEPVDS